MDNSNSQSDSPYSSQSEVNKDEAKEGQITQPKIGKEKADNSGFFSPEKKGIQKGVIGGIAMMLIAVVWFVAGYAAGYIFYYPPILFLIGLYAFIKGIITGNIRGEKAQRDMPEIVDTARISSYSSLFDTERFGINIYVGIGYLIASMLTIFTWRISFSMMGFELNSNPPLDYYIIIFAFNLLEAAALVFLSYKITKTWMLPVMFGLAMIVIGIGHRVVFSTIPIENMNFGSPFAPSNIIFNFIWGFLLMAGLVLIVKFWGLRLWSFILGMILTFCIREALMQLYYIANGSSFFWKSLIPQVLNGLIYGGFIFAGLALQLRQKGFKLYQGSILTESDQ